MHTINKIPSDFCYFMFHNTEQVINDINKKSLSSYF